MTPTPTAPGVNVSIPDTLLSHYSLDQLITKGLEYILAAVAIGAFISIVYSGVMMITSGGDATKFATARNNIIWALIGIFVALLSFVIVKTTYGLIHSVSMGQVQLNDI